MYNGVTKPFIGAFRYRGTLKYLKFGTKCILLSKRPLKGVQPEKITLNGNELPWVSKVKHLGHVLRTDNSMKIDVC